MVARYSKYGSDNHFIDRNGKWVKFEDYQNLDFKLQELEAKLREFAEQVMYAPCSKVTEEMASEILGI